MTEKANQSWVHVRRKVARLGEPHVRPLVDLADEIAAARRLEAGSVPYPDPDHGGIGAEVLFILTSPGNKARKGTGSGLLSLENDDDGAARCHREAEHVGLEWSQMVHWNLVPFPIANERRPSVSDCNDGVYWLPQVLALLQELRVVVLLARIFREAAGSDLGRVLSGVVG